MHYKLRRISTQFVMYLGIEFYLFVSHGGMNYRGSTCKFRNARSAFRNLHVDPLSFIYTWFTRSYLYFIKIEPFWLGNICFLIQNTRSFFYGRHYSSLHRLMSLHGKLNVKIFLMFIVAENTGSVNITNWTIITNYKVTRLPENFSFERFMIGDRRSS